MMKFLLPFLAGVFLLSSISFYWVVCFFLAGIFLFILLFFMNSLDYVYFSTFFGTDLLSFSLIVLSVWVTILMYYSSFSVYNSTSGVYFMFWVYMLLLSLFFSFSVVNYLSFYFFFEFSLIPTLLIIMGWGYQPERLQAGVYFLFYTLTASLPLLASLIYLYYFYGGLDNLLYLCYSGGVMDLILFLGLSMAFLAKMPMFFVHLWLPKAHVEAPVSGSMILAGVLLKLGGYGLCRVLGFSLVGLLNYGGYLLGLSILGMMYVGFMCCRLNDLKALVAYSSVAHMALVICGVYSYYVWGFSGSLMMMISHGLSSSGLFCIVNMYYERLGSRSMFLNKGLILLLPVFTLMFFMLCASNIAAPPTVNLLSEIFLMSIILKFSKFMLLFFPLGSFLGAVFTLFMFSYTQHGKSYLVGYSYTMLNYRESHTLMLHIIPVNFLILKSEYFMFMY